MRRILVFVVVVLLGCEDTESTGEPISIGECDTHQNLIVEQGIDDLNRVAGETVLYVSDECDDCYKVVCKRGYWQPKGMGAQFVGGVQIELYVDRLEDDTFLMNAVKHELGHLVDGDGEIDDHSPNPSDVMYHALTGVHRYTKADVAFLRDSLPVDKI